MLCSTLAGKKAISGSCQAYSTDNKGNKLKKNINEFQHRGKNGDLCDSFVGDGDVLPNVCTRMYCGAESTATTTVSALCFDARAARLQPHALQSARAARWPCLLLGCCR